MRPRSVSGQSQVSSRSVPGQSQVSASQSQVSLTSQVSLRSVPGQSQVSFRSLLDLSDLASSLRRSLKYFVLFKNVLEGEFSFGFFKHDFCFFINNFRG